jgi:hypothetical protein
VIKRLSTLAHRRQHRQAAGAVAAILIPPDLRYTPIEERKGIRDVGNHYDRGNSNKKAAIVGCS